MPNAYNPEKRTVGNLLSLTNPPIRVPDWQRSYSWTTTEVEMFWKDLLTFSERYPDDNVTEQEYFLGSIVVVDNGKDHLLLDGQQRLVTSSILLSVIRDYLKRYKQDAANRVQQRYLGDFDDAKNEYLYKITLNSYDRDYFKRAILETRDAAYTEPKAELESHRLIAKARKYFEDIFTETYAAFPEAEDAYKWALRIQQVLTNHMSVVAVFSGDEDNAATVFEALNDRGIGLSTPDLVRNFLLRRAVASNREEITDIWREVLEVEDDAPLKTFLRHYWITHYGDVKTRSLYREIKSNVTDANIDSLVLSRKFRDSALVYRDILASRNEDERIAALLRDANEVDAKLLYPLFLSLLESENDPGKVVTIARASIVALIRHSVIGGRENSRLENLVYKLARELRQDRNVDSVVTQLSDFAPDNASFQKSFETVSIARSATARYILRKLEESKRNTEELEVAPPNKVHVEHIYPQSPREGQRLDAHARIINRLGNLTLLSKRLNVTIRNAPFAEKKPAYQASELLITKEIVSLTEWNESTIEERQKDLAKLAPAIWTFSV